MRIKIPEAIRHGKCSPGSKRILEKKKKKRHDHITLKHWGYNKTQIQCFESLGNGRLFTAFMLWSRDNNIKRKIYFSLIAIRKTVSFCKKCTSKIHKANLQLHVIGD